MDGDGCDSSCAIEVGWTCDGREAHPSTGLVMSACTKTAINIFPQELTMVGASLRHPLAACQLDPGPGQAEVLGRW